MKDRILELLQNVPLELQVFILSLVPVTGLKAAIPYGIVRGLAPLEAVFLAVFSEILLIIILLLGLPVLAYILCAFSWTRCWYDKLVGRVQKHRDVVDRYGPWGLFLFVAIPFPGSGAWSGALLAFVLGLPFWRSAVPLTVGLVVSGVIVVAASLGLKAMAALEGGLEVGLIVVAAVAFLWWLKKRKRL